MSNSRRSCKPRSSPTRNWPQPTACRSRLELPSRTNRYPGLTALGHTPQTASSGREGLATLSEKVDAVLLDLNMPGMDGIEVLRRIRSQESPPAVVVLTAFASAENTIEAMRLGAFDHLTKPIGRDELKALLERLPSRQRPVITASKGSLDTLVGSSEGMRRVQKANGLAADSP